MLARAAAATPWGIESRLVQVEVDVNFGLPQTHIVGLAHASVRESRERVRSAVKNCGFDLPPRVVIINLAPADMPKAGNQLDLAIALALLAAHGHLPQSALDGRLFCGELGLDGAVHPVRGGLAIADLGRRLGSRELLLPAPNAGEAAALGGMTVIPVPNLTAALGHLSGEQPIAGVGPGASVVCESALGPDLAEVAGQESVKRALEVAAAGGHNLLLLGPPGSGKTMLARRLPGLLPPLSPQEALDVTKIHSVAGDEPPSGLILRRPFRSPHSGTSTAGMIGGGSPPRPGEASLAHCGVLFLDELPEFRRETLEALRQPLEEGFVSVVRVRAHYRYPARFSLLAAMNACPCGHLGDSRTSCRCTPQLIERYRSRLSGPLLDRIDLHIEVPSVTLKDLRTLRGEPSTVVATRVAAARAIQLQRFGSHAGTPTNAAMGPASLRRHCILDATGKRLLDCAFERLGLSARALDRILKVARTLADLEGAIAIRPADLAEAIQYRTLDRRLSS